MTNDIVSTLESLLKINSPTGYTIDIINYIEDLFKAKKNLFIKRTNKGSLSVSFSERPGLMLSGHIDTLGAMVKEINSNGTIGITQLGSYPLNSFEGEYVTIRNSSGKMLRGTLLLNNPADHVNRKVRTEERNLSTMSVRLDELNTDEKNFFGINPGDFIFYDTRYEQTESGFIKSRFLDDKACAAVMIELIKDLSNSKNINSNTGFYFSNYEEVGHGGTCGYSSTIKELLVIDMGTLGDGLEGDEFSCSICAKDNSGPYDYNFRKKLVEICKKNNIAYKVDVYPYYSSDGSAALLAGNEFRVALIGPGVAASHGMERTHKDGIEATIQLCLKYISTDD
jgi:putative aminopeptidase FrvX